MAFTFKNNLRTGKVYTATTHNLNDLPLEELGNRILEDFSNKDTHLIDFCKHWKLDSKPWFAEQLFSTLAREFNPGTERNITTLIKKHYNWTPKNTALWALGTIDTRSSYVANQAKSRFSALTPMILGSFKQFHNIGYSEWEELDLGKALDKNQRKALEFDILAAYSALDTWDANESGFVNTLESKRRLQKGTAIPDLGSSRNEKLEFIRNNTMWYRDKRMNPETFHQLVATNTPFDKAPWLIKVTVFQIWAAHPNNRNTSLNILDYTSLDNTPDPIVSSTVCTPTENLNSVERPWWED